MDTKDVFLSGTLSIHYSDDTSTCLAKTIRVIMKSKFASSHVGCLLNHCLFTIALRCASIEMPWPVKHAKYLLERCAKRAQWLCGIKVQLLKIKSLLLARSTPSIIGIVFLKSV